MTFQFGGRVDHTSYDAERRARAIFTTGSGSLGLLFRPAAADDRLTIALSAGACGAQPGARGAVLLRRRTPATSPSRSAIPSCEPEHALGFDVVAALAHVARDGRGHLLPERHQRLRVPGAAHRGGVRSAARRSSRRGSRAATSRDAAESEEFPIVEYVAADSVLQGIEAHADVQVTSQLAVELGLDYVRGTLKDDDEPLPRIPPLRFRGGLRYQRNAFQAGGDVSAVATQDRVFSTRRRPTGISCGSLLRVVLIRSRAPWRTPSRRDSTT